MSAKFRLGIDTGGTHTDAALIRDNGEEKNLLAAAKVKTCHEALPVSIYNALAELAATLGSDSAAVFSQIVCVSIGATLAVNALAQDKLEAVGLALSAGPGLNPLRFAIGEYACTVPGGLDHRGVEVCPLETRVLSSVVKQWAKEGLRACACVGKFSPRNPAHERAMAEVATGPGFSVTQGHLLSGSLNFPRRIATSYYNAAVGRLHHAFLDAVEKALAGAGIRAPTFLIKADGGAVPLSLSRRCPAQSILSGPAAGVMGVLALCPSVARGCSLLLDMGGTTTDIALVLDGFPVIERDGMSLNGRRTLVRSLASISVGVGGDSLLSVDASGVHAGPAREGPALAFGGTRAALLDAFNTFNAENGELTAGDAEASIEGLVRLAATARGKTATDFAESAINDGMERIRQASASLLHRINSRPVYTLAALKAARGVEPERIVLVGGPSACVLRRVEKLFGLPVEIPAHADVANAIGAALALPTASLEIYADTGRGILRIPALDAEERIGGGFTLEAAVKRAKELLAQQSAEDGAPGTLVEVLEADLFATLSDSGCGARDIRVVCQASPGIAGRLSC